MIQALQRFSQSRTAKVFLAIVALSFMAFFGGGSWFRPHDPNAVIAEVGSYTIGRSEFGQKVQERIHQIMSQQDQSMTREQLLNAGLPQMVLSQLIQDSLLNLEAGHLGITVSDETIRQQIQSMKAFQNDKGVFERNLFTQVLRSNGLSEDFFIGEIRQEIIREQLRNAIMVGAYLPEEMVSRLFDAQYQHRQASMLMVSPKDMPAPPPPSNEVLEAFYNEHQKAFETPEVRALDILLVDPEVMAKEIPVTEEEIKAAYEAKAKEFDKKPLEEVKGLIIAEIQKEKAIEKVHTMTQELEDKIAGGATFSEMIPVFKQNGLQYIQLQIAANGKNPMGTESIQQFADKDLAIEMLKTAFDLEEGADSPFIQGHDGKYYAIRVDKITPAHFQAFAEIKDRVLKTWTEMEQFKAAQAKAEEYINAFNQGNRTAAMMTLLPNLSLAEPSPTVANEVKQKVFSLRPQQAGAALTPEGIAVVVLNTIIPPDEKVKEEKMTTFKEALLQQYQSDLLMAYLNSLRIRYPVKVNGNGIKALFSA